MGSDVVVKRALGTCADTGKTAVTLSKSGTAMSNRRQFDTEDSRVAVVKVAAI
jgi:hypothetical protein